MSSSLSLSDGCVRHRSCTDLVHPQCTCLSIQFLTPGRCLQAVTSPLMLRAAERRHVVHFQQHCRISGCSGTRHVYKTGRSIPNTDWEYLMYLCSQCSGSGLSLQQLAVEEKATLGETKTSAALRNGRSQMPGLMQAERIVEPYGTMYQRHDERVQERTKLKEPTSTGMDQVYSSTCKHSLHRC